MDTWQARIQGIKGSERKRSLPFMLIKPSWSKDRERLLDHENIQRGLLV